VSKYATAAASESRNNNQTKYIKEKQDERFDILFHTTVYKRLKKKTREREQKMSFPRKHLDVR
jgi:hypothetical protein